MSHPAPRVIAAARYPAIRAGLRELLTRAGIEVAGELDLGDEAAPVLDTMHIDVVVADLTAATADDRLSLDEAIESRPAVLLLDVAHRVPLAQRESAARGWLLSDSDGDAIAAAVRAVAAGLTVLDPAIAAASADTSAGLVGSLGGPLEAAEDPRLTPRELEVLQLLAAGLPNKVVARRLDISEHTVKFHVSALLSKLDAQSRTEAVTAAVRRGLLAL